MKARLPAILMVAGSAFLLFGYFLAPGLALPRLIGFIILGFGFYLRRRS